MKHPELEVLILGYLYSVKLVLVGAICATNADFDSTVIKNTTIASTHFTTVVTQRSGNIFAVTHDVDIRLVATSHVGIFIQLAQL